MDVAGAGLMARGGRMPGGAVPLGGPTLMAKPEQVEKVRKLAEMKAGMRCGGCEERITIGFEFVHFHVEMREVDGAKIPVHETRRIFACSRDGCGFAELVAQDADAMRPVEWAFLDHKAIEEPGQATG